MSKENDKKIKRKYADGRNVKDILDSTFKNIKIDQKEFKGNISLLKIHKVRKIWKVEKEQRCILADGYNWLQIYHEGKNHCITAMYNEKNELVQWYIDISKRLGVENDIPFEDDLYLDVVLVPDGQIILLDEDELQEALENKIITKQEYNLAYNEANKIIKEGKENMKKLKHFTDKYLLKMLEEGE